MSNENNVKENILNVLFESREENICVLTDKDKERIKNLTKDNDSYAKLYELIENTSNLPENTEKIKNSLDSYIDRINIIGAYENEKFYKIRFFRCNKFNIRMC